MFCRTRAGVDRLGSERQLDSIPLSTLHGGLNQRQRDRAMNKFTSGRSMVLIATDVAARGIDVEGVNCVIHYDPPDDAKAYKHRSGRTARAGHSGVVICFVKGNEQRIYGRIQKQVGIRKRFTDPRPEDLKKNDFKIAKEEPRKRTRRNCKKRKFIFWKCSRYFFGRGRSVVTSTTRCRRDWRC